MTFKGSVMLVDDLKCKIIRCSSSVKGNFISTEWAIVLPLVLSQRLTEFSCTNI